MKKLILISTLLLTSLFYFNLSFAKEKCSDCLAVQKVKAEVSQKIQRTDQQKDKLVMKVVATIEKALKSKDKKNRELIIADIVALLGAINKMDSYHITAETAMDAYIKEKKVFDKYLNKLPYGQGKAVHESFKIIIREEREGNG